MSYKHRQQEQLAQRMRNMAARFGAKSRLGQKRVWICVPPSLVASALNTMPPQGKGGPNAACTE
eukprot:6143189-Amphidinium_carterae.1